MGCFFLVPVGEQRRDKAAVARCVQLLPTHGKHYAARRALINGEIVQNLLFLIHVFTHCVSCSAGLVVFLKCRLKALQMGAGLMDSLTDLVSSFSRAGLPRQASPADSVRK